MKNLPFILITYLFFCSVANSAMSVIDLAAQKERSTQSIWERTQREREYIEFTNQTTQLTKSVATGRAILENAENQLKAMTENLQRGVGFARISKSLADLIMQDKSGFNNIKSEITKKPLDITKPQDVEQLIDQHFLPSKRAGRRHNYRHVKAAYQQQSYKSAIKTAELVINNADKRRREIENEVQKINVTQSTKDSQDLNNRLMAELLLETQKNNILLAQLVRSSSAKQYIGVNPDAKVTAMTSRERSRAGNIVPQSSYYDKKTPSGKTFKTLDEVLQQKRSRSW